MDSFIVYCPFTLHQRNNTQHTVVAPMSDLAGVVAQQKKKKNRKKKSSSANANQPASTEVVSEQNEQMLNLVTSRIAKMESDKLDGKVKFDPSDVDVRKAQETAKAR
jgi:hypothetical protein